MPRKFLPLLIVSADHCFPSVEEYDWPSDDTATNLPLPKAMAFNCASATGVQAQAAPSTDQQISPAEPTATNRAGVSSKRWWQPLEQRAKSSTAHGINRFIKSPFRLSGAALLKIQPPIFNLFHRICCAYFFCRKTNFAFWPLSNCQQMIQLKLGVCHRGIQGHLKY